MQLQESGRQSILAIQVQFFLFVNVPQTEVVLQFLLYIKIALMAVYSMKESLYIFLYTQREDRTILSGRRC